MHKICFISPDRDVIPVQVLDALVQCPRMNFFTEWESDRE